VTDGDAPRFVDVDRLVDELRERVAARRAAGEYDERLTRAPFRRSAGAATVTLRMETAYSSKPVVGPVITAGKRAVIRGLWHFLDDAVGQANAALSLLQAELRAEREARSALAGELRSAQERIVALTDRLASLEEGRRSDGATLGETVQRLTALEDLQPGARLARLERPGRAAPSEPPGVRPIDPALVALARRAAPVDDLGEERLDAYVSALAAPTLVLGCGEGELLARCAALGVEAYGVDADEAAVAACRARGFHVEPADPLTHLSELPEGGLGGLVALGIGDRFGGEGWAAFADLAATRLRPGGTVVVEVVNPLTSAGMALRLRDPTLAPPVHPETIGFLLRVAGFSRVETRLLGAFGPDLRAPLPEALEGPYRDELARVVEHVNRVAVGQPLAAVIARR
jgi:hypothetical protein